MNRFDPDRSPYEDPRKSSARRPATPKTTPETTFFFYDLETSGLNSRGDRIMQFAGQRTTMDFEPLGDPVNVLVKLSDDTLPSPAAIMVTGISPQSTQLDGFTEAEFCHYVATEIFTPSTIEVGYNSIRFDDEFMRHTFWRNFHDPYEWQWKDGRSKWDLLDVVRLTRALRPEGISWPVAKSKDSSGDDASSEDRPTATNRLELLTKFNGIKHTHAHDALSDVEALISVTKLIHDRQPELYDYLLRMRDKNELKKLVNLDHKVPFVYACGRYSSAHNKTSVAVAFAPGRNGNVLVFDLRYNLEELLEQEKNFQPEEKTDRYGKKYQTRWNWSPMVKELAFNHCPAVAPLGVLEAASTEDSTDPTNPCKKGTTGWQKLGLEKEQIKANLKTLFAHPEFAERMRSLYENLPEFPRPVDAESALYDGFVSDDNRKKCAEIRRRSQGNAATAAAELADFDPGFSDLRLSELLVHYKARNFPTSLTEAEQLTWEKYRRARLSQAEKFFVVDLTHLQKLAASGKPLDNGHPVDESLLEDLALWYQSLAGTDY